MIMEEKNHKEHNHNHEHEHSHKHEHEHTVACENYQKRTTRLDRLIMLIIAIALSVIFLRPLIAYQSFMRGYSYTELDKPEPAVKHLKRSINIDSKNDQAWSLLAYNLKKLGKLKESIKAYEKTLELNPEDFQAAIEYALLKFEQKDYENARKILEKHLKKKAELVDGWLLLARACEKSGDTETAVKIYMEIYTKIDPGNKVAEGKLREYNKL